MRPSNVSVRVGADAEETSIEACFEAVFQQSGSADSLGNNASASIEEKSVVSDQRDDDVPDEKRIEESAEKDERINEIFLKQRSDNDIMQTLSMTEYDINVDHAYRLY